MADFLTPSERSERMSKIRSRNTSPELAMRRELHRLGLRFRLNSTLPGKPDLVLARHKAVVFVHGCFWHRHQGCNIATTPKSNTPYWKEKFDRNVARDRRVLQELAHAGWRVFVVWECQLQSKARARQAAENLVQQISGEHGGGGITGTASRNSRRLGAVPAAQIEDDDGVGVRGEPGGEEALEEDLQRLGRDLRQDEGQAVVGRPGVRQRRSRPSLSGGRT